MTLQAAAKADLCAIEGCGSREYPLHFMHYGNRFTRLCTSCVLKTNPGMFCTHCFFLIAGNSPSAIVHCSRCRMVAHLNCLQNPNSSSQYLCPGCRSNNSSTFRWFSHESGTLINDLSLRGLHSAVSLVNTLNKQAVEKMNKIAEEKMKAALDSKLLAERLVEVSLELHKEIREKKRKINPVINAVRVVPKGRVTNREFEKWSRYHEMTVGDDISDLMSSPKNSSVSTVSNQVKHGLQNYGLAQSRPKLSGSGGMNGEGTSSSVHARDAVVSNKSFTNLKPTVAIKPVTQAGTGNQQS